MRGDEGVIVKGAKSSTSLGTFDLDCTSTDYSILLNNIDCCCLLSSSYYYYHCSDIEEKVAIAELTLSNRSELFEKRVGEGVTYLSVIEEFPSARPPLADLFK